MCNFFPLPVNFEGVTATFFAQEQEIDMDNAYV